eukprot:270827-Chlamydomonas_euryale.AAC.3
MPVTNGLAGSLHVLPCSCVKPSADVVKTRLQLQRLKCEKGGGKPPGLVRQPCCATESCIGCDMYPCIHMLRDVSKIWRRVPSAYITDCYVPQIRTGINCVQQEGMLVMWSGLTPALVRGFTYGGIRLGLYTPLKGMIANAGSDGQVREATADPRSPQVEVCGVLRCMENFSSASWYVEAPHKGHVNQTLGGKLAAGSISGSIASAITNPTELVKVRWEVFYHFTPVLKQNIGDAACMRCCHCVIP